MRKILMSLLVLFAFVTVANAFPIWKTITIGNKDVRLVRASIEDLGFQYTPTYVEIIGKAKEFGLEVGSAEIADGLRREYDDQKTGEHLFLMTLPVNGKFQVYDIYRVEKSMSNPNGSLCEDKETKDFLDDYKYDYKLVGEHYFVFIK